MATRKRTPRAAPKPAAKSVETETETSSTFNVGRGRGDLTPAVVTDPDTPAKDADVAEWRAYAEGKVEDPRDVYRLAVAQLRVRFQADKRDGVRVAAPTGTGAPATWPPVPDAVSARLTAEWRAWKFAPSEGGPRPQKLSRTAAAKEGIRGPEFDKFLAFLRASGKNVVAVD